MTVRSILSKAPILRRLWSRLLYSQKQKEFRKEFYRFKELAQKRQDLPVTWSSRYPCLDDNTGTTGFDRHYVFHTAWAARKLADLKPIKHTDISSSLYFSAIASAFVPTDFYDYRPAQLNLNNLSSQPGDLLNLPFKNGALTSLSCMHVLEHIGLGRYGDPLDAFGDIKAINELKRVLAVDGSLLIALPVGAPKVMFNAHRIYSYEQVIEYFSDLHLEEFSLIPDHEADGGLIRRAPPSMVREQTYACGCFHFKKLIA